MPLHSDQAILAATPSSDVPHPGGLLQPVERSPEFISAHQTLSGPALNSEKQTRLAALNFVCGSRPDAWSILQSLSLRQWLRLLCWLDYSGLALYFFDQMRETRQLGTLPGPITAGLERRLHENTQRTAAMLAESVEIQTQFQRSGVRYAVQKGLSLWPNSVPRPELRLQFDLDYLVSPGDLARARGILDHKGYRLYENIGREWAFKRNEKPGFGFKDLYRDTGSFRVELHADAPAAAPRLDRIEWRKLRGFTMPVLAPVDLFLAEGLHACKHVCAEFVRSAYLVEFRRHALFRRGDDAFWRALERRGVENARAPIGLGVTTLLITLVTGEFAPQALTCWTADRVPPAVRLWLELYAHRVVLGSYPGSKFHLLLERKLGDSCPLPQRTLRESMIPLRVPRPVIHASPNEALTVRARRYWMLLEYILLRLRFHLVEGLRFARELRRWRRVVHQIAP